MFHLAVSSTKCLSLLSTSSHLILTCRTRYDESLRLNWRRGKRFRMWWEAPDTPGIGTWWTGTVLGRVQRDRFDPRRSSPWEALRVKWDS